MLVGKSDGEESTQVSRGELVFIVIFDKLGVIYTVRLPSFRTGIKKKYLRERNDTFIV